MKDFPSTLQHGSGVMMIIDRSRLLLSLKQPHKQKEVDSLVQAFGLVVETGRRVDFEPNNSRISEQISYVINNTETRFWIRSKDDMEINDELFNTVEQQLAESLEWLGPVYRLANTSDLGGLLCPIPNVLLVKQTKMREEPRDREISSDMSAVRTELKEIPEKSKYLSGYHYFIITDTRRQNSYQLRAALQEEAKGLDVRFENMPMIIPTTFVPNDIHYAEQWNMERIQAGGAGTTGWDLSVGNATIVICILDTGCDLTHPDLQFFSQGIDLGTMADDGGPNGLDPPFGDAHHGTHSAGVAASRFNNNLGVAGVAGACQIMPLAFHNFTDVEVAAGINYASDNGARVISMSFGQYAPGEGMTPTGWDFAIIDPAIDHSVNDRGCVLCAATGNENVSTYNRYPARHALVMACGASNQADNRKSWEDESQWGSNFADGVSVVAPGISVPTTDRQGDAGWNQGGDYYMNWFGTSAATPHVSGFAALLLSLYPDLTNKQVQDITEKTAQKVGTVAYTEQPGFTNGTRNQEMGYGRLNVLRGLDFADVMIKDWWNDSGAEPSTPPAATSGDSQT